MDKKTSNITPALVGILAGMWSLFGLKESEKGSVEMRSIEVKSLLETAKLHNVEINAELYENIVNKVYVDTTEIIKELGKIATPLFAMISANEKTESEA